MQRAVIERSGVDPKQVDQIVGGCVSQVGEQSYNVARTAWLPLEVPATTVDSQCGSSQQANTLAAGLVGSELEDVVLSCGVEVMSRVPLGSNFRDKALGRPISKSDEAPVLGEDAKPSGESLRIERDEGLRASSLEKLAALEPVVPGGLHTAGTSSQITDGEVNEAFASVVLAWQQATGAVAERV